MKLQDVTKFIAGSPQFRIREAVDKSAPCYTYYGQSEMDNDLVGLELRKGEGKQIVTLDAVQTIACGDIIFSLISGVATIASKRYVGYLCTQNYVKLVPNTGIEPRYLVYLLNENQYIKRQLQMGLQGTSVLKYTVKQLRELVLPALPTMEKQRLIGEIYFNQLRLQALRQRAAKLETILTLQKLKEVDGHE